MKRILFIIDSLACGGAEKSLVSLLSLLNREKYRLFIWIRVRGGDFEPLLPKDVEIVDAPLYSIIENIKYNISSLVCSLTLRLKRFFGIKEHGAETLWKTQGWAIKVPKGHWDTVVAYQQGIPTYLVAKKFKKCKKCAWVNANILDVGYNLEFNKQFYNNMDIIVPVSDILHDLLKTRMPEFDDKYNTVYDIINPSIIRTWAKQPAQALKNSNTIIIIVTVGRLVKPKGYDLAVDAADILRKKGLKFKWYFIGEGSERQVIEQDIKARGLENHVFLLGQQSNPYIYMRQADVYVQTSKSEGFGMTITEAKILRKPVVCTNFEVIYDQLTNEKNGLIVEKSGNSIADGIFRLITDAKLTDKIIGNLKEEKFLTVQSEVQKVENFL